MRRFGETGDPPVTVAKVRAKSQQNCNFGGDTSAATGTSEVKLDVSQFNVTPGKATGLIYDPKKLLIPSTVRQPAALPASAPHKFL